MSLGLVVVLAEVLVLFLLALLGRQIHRLWLAEKRPADSDNPAPLTTAVLPGHPDDILADYIGELLAGAREVRTGDLAPAGHGAPGPTAEPAPKPPAADRELPSVAALLGRRCDPV